MKMLALEQNFKNRNTLHPLAIATIMLGNK